MGEHQLLQRRSADLPVGGYRRTRADQGTGAAPSGAALEHGVAGEAFRPAGEVDHGVCLGEFVDAAAQPGPASLQEQQVVACVGELGHDVRGHHHRAAGVGDIGHEQAHQLSAGDHVQVGHRLVQQQVGPFTEGKSQRDPGAFAAGEITDPVAPAET